MTVLVVGGGITGLTTAYALGQAGVRTVLAEASGRLGGKVVSEQIDGFLVESGPDSFVNFKPAAVQLCRELGLADSIIRVQEPRTVLVRARGRWGHLPEGMGLVLPSRMRPFVTSDLFSWPEKLRMGLDLLLPRQRLDGDIAVGPFLRRRLGRALVERLADPLIGGVYGTPIEELSLLGVVPQLREYERRYRSLMLASLALGRASRKAARAAARSGAARASSGASPGSGGSPFVTLAGGTAQLTGALADTLAHSPNVVVRMQSAVVEIAPRSAASGGGFDARLAGGETMHADAVVVATPGPAAATMVEAFAPAAAASIRGIRHGTTAVVSLGYRLEQFARPPIGHGFLVASSEPLAVDACTISSQKWAGRAPEGTLLLRVFVGARQPSLLSATDDEVITAVGGALEMALGVHGAPIMHRIARWPGVMPHYTVGHVDRVTAATTALEATPGLFLAGAPYRGIGLPDCVAQGRAAAEKVLGVLGG